MSSGQHQAWMWTRYWQRGAYDEPCLSQALNLSTIWRDHFSTFADGARLLDLATGSGDAAELASSVARELGRNFQIDAIDAAQLPATLVQGLHERGVQLKGEIDLACLPFEDGGFDGVFSQFGIEYGKRPDAFREAARVLRRNGRGLLVMHHRQSEVTQNCAARLARHYSIIGSTQCFIAARQVFTSYLMGASLPILMRAEARFRNEVAVLRRRLGVPAADPNLVGVVEFLIDIAATPARYDPADALRRIQFAEEEILSWRSRQEAQQHAAMNPDEVNSVCDQLAAMGLNVRPAEVVRGGHGEIVAWKLAFERSE